MVFYPYLNKNRMTSGDWLGRLVIDREQLDCLWINYRPSVTWSTGILNSDWAYLKTSCILTNMWYSPNTVSMLALRLRRWPNIETALGECPVFAILANTCVILSFHSEDSENINSSCLSCCFIGLLI